MSSLSKAAYTLAVLLLLLCSVPLNAQQDPGGRPENGVRSGDAVFFTAFTPAHGEALWRTDGTQAGTWLVADPVPAPAVNDIGVLADFGGSLLFTVRIGETTELWRSDGGHSWSRVLRFGSSPITWMRAVGGRVFLLYGDNKMMQLWVTDGTTAGTRHVRTFSEASTPVVASRSIYFNGKAYRAGRGLWRSDGTVEGTTLLGEFSYTTLATFHDYVLYERNRQLVRDGGGEAPQVLGAVDTLNVSPGAEVFYFRDSSDSARGRFWRSDGTVAGTKKLLNGAGSPVAVVRDRLLFYSSSTHFSINELDVPVALFNGAFILDSPIFWGDRLVFEHQGRLFVTDGTVTGTRLLVPAELGLVPRPLAVLGERLLFSGNDGFHGRELWAYDARSGEVALVRNLVVEAAIEGRVIDASTGEPARGRVVVANRSLPLDAEGRFRGEGFAPGTYFVRTANTSSLIDELRGSGACPPCPSQAAAWVSLNEGMTTRVDFALARGAALQGRVTHARTGAPVGNATVAVVRSGEPVSFAGSVVTDADGRWALPNGAPPGTYFVDVHATPGFLTKRSEVFTVSGTESRTIDVQLTAETIITGTVRSAVTGEPLDGADVSARSAPGLEWTGRTSADGSFRFHVQPGTYAVKASRYSFEPHTAEVRVGAEQTVTVDLLLEPGATIRGRVVDLRTGKPIPGALVAAARPSFPYDRIYATADAQGRFSIKNVPRGHSYRLDAQAAGYRVTLWPADPCDFSYLALCQFWTAVEVKADDAVVELPEDLRMYPASIVRGRVTSAAGAPLPGVYVTFYSAEGRWVKQVFTNAAGLYEAELYPGGFRIVFHGSSLSTFLYGVGTCTGNDCLQSRGKVLTLSPETAVSVDAVLLERPVVKGRVFDSRTGEALRSATVSLGGGLVLTTGREGQPWELVLSAPANVTATAVIAGYVSGSSGPLFVDWDERKTLDIYLDPLTTVSGRVTDAVTGAPMNLVDVGVIDRNGEVVGAARTDRDGRYTAAFSTMKECYVFAFERIGMTQKQFWRGVTCDDCRLPPAGATPLRSTTPLTGIDFALSAPAVTVNFSFTLDGTPLAGAGVELFAPGKPHSVRPEATSNADGKLTLAVPAGAYHVRSWNTLGLVDVLPGGISCAAPCDVSAGGLLNVLPGSSPEMTLALRRAGASELVPRAGMRQGGERATLHGAGFRPGVRVLFGGTDAAVLGVTDTQVELRVPSAGVPGKVEVAVIHHDGTREGLPGGYHYGERCAPFYPEVVQIRDGAFVTLQLRMNGVTPRAIRWYDEGPGAPLLTRLGEGSALIVPLDRAGRHVYGVRVITDCHDVQLAVPVEPMLRRRPAN